MHSRICPLAALVVIHCNARTGYQDVTRSAASAHCAGSCSSVPPQPPAEASLPPLNGFNYGCGTTNNNTNCNATCASGFVGAPTLSCTNGLWGNWTGGCFRRELQRDSDLASSGLHQGPAGTLVGCVWLPQLQHGRHMTQQVGQSVNSPDSLNNPPVIALHPLHTQGATRQRCRRCPPMQTQSRGPPATTRTRASPA